MSQWMKGTYGIIIRLETMGKPQPSSSIRLFNYHSVMVEIDKYINNVENYGLVMPPGHSTLQNISHIHMTYSWIKEWNTKFVQDISAAAIV